MGVGWVRAAWNAVLTTLSPPRGITLDLQPMHTFDLAPQPVDRLLAAMRSGSTGAVSRVDALSVAAVLRGRNELCAIATLPLRLYKGLTPVDSPLFRQFDMDVPNVVHMSMTIEDLAFDGLAWWQVVGTDFAGYPMAVRRICPDRVTLTRPNGPPQPDDARWVWIKQLAPRTGWDQVPVTTMIRFDSPVPGLLKTQARAIRIARQLDNLIELYANNPALRDLFTANTDAPVDLLDDDEVNAFLAEWTALRQASPAGYVPPSLKRADVSYPSPKDLTLVELRDAVNLAIANGLGVDPEDLGVNTTSRTYFNGVDRRQEKVNRTYSPYMLAITDRLGMGDVTMRGYQPRHDLSDFLKSDPNTQAGYWAQLQTMGVVDAMWIGEQAGIDPAVTARAQRAVPAPPAAAAIGQNAHRPAIRLGDVTPARFDGGPAYTFDSRDFSAAVPAPTADAEARTITGLAVPYGGIANKYGIKITFDPGSLEYGDPALMPHLQDHGAPVGVHRSIKDTAAGPVVSLSVGSGPEGSTTKAARDQLLYDAADGLYSGLSIGVDYSLDPQDGDVEIDDDGVYHVKRATWRETSSTYLPAFNGARVTRVAASLTGGNPVERCQHCGHQHLPGIACQTFIAQLRAQPNEPTPNPAPNPAPQPPAPNPIPQPNTSMFGASQPAGTVQQSQVTPEQWAAFSAYMQAQTGAAWPGQPAGPTAGPTAVNPRGQALAQVSEPLPYRYDRHGNLRNGSHDFSADIAIGYNPKYQGSESREAADGRIKAWLQYAFGDGDDGARHLGRLDLPGDATQQQFAITPANVVNLNYPANRPDLYVDQLDYLYPMYQAFNKGTLDTVTPFVLPKFNSSSGLVGDHVSGTEPTPGAFTATAQTITPSALSGKVEILREVFDQGGNPQASGLIWRQMVRGWYEGIEAAIQAFFVAQSASIPDIALGIAVTDAAMDQALASAITALQFIRGGDRFTKVFTQIDLYQKLAKAVDTTGRPLYPSFGAMNANGLMGPEQNYLNVRGKTFVPEWATAATGTVAASSWMMDPDVVGLWLSTPQRLDLEWRVAWVDLGIWGYKALAITDFTRTRELIYDPV
jgi:hypothetical protein